MLIETLDFTIDDISKISVDYEKRFQKIRSTKKRMHKLNRFNKKLIRFSKSPISTIKRVAQRSINGGLPS